ncbi:hypothetical protein GCM10011360_17670 [Primorskyibacter flagellatus]|uniref:Uncharacterized protein n=1 Tax=Primorskyibacter flagellatus TaxID=1387277 RepID=A0A917EFU9_9RHOB|nr:hypothetical protein [Primorskyibacter flagellatus]GGE30042.1 hypothetical protein GCM10011360_17670 [Primorskyibacter flagellatus]
MQLELFALPPTKKHMHGATWRVGAYECRNWHGWFQSREGGKGNWLFQIHGFSGPEDGNGIAHVYRVGTDGDLYDSPVPIDGPGRITINGRKYGRDHWNH